MRRAAALVITPLLAALAVAGCSSSSSSSHSAAASTSAAAGTYKSVTVAAGQLNQAPKVTIPKVKGTGDLYTKTLIKGTGATFTSETSEAVLGNYVAYDWSGATSKELGTSFGSGSQSIFTGTLLTGLKNALVGQKMGSRVLAVIPPKDGLGANGPSQGIGASDTLVFVIDMNQVFSPTITAKQTSTGGGPLPTVTAPAAGSTAGPTIKVNTKATPPKALQVKVLAKGAGPVVKSGQNIVVQYTGLLWRNGQVFDSSWSRGGQPLDTVIGAGKVVKGWDSGLVGQTVGSRVLLVLPPAEGYGSSGQAAAGIKGTDTLVFAVDILLAY